MDVYIIKICLLVATTYFNVALTAEDIAEDYQEQNIVERTVGRSYSLTTCDYKSQVGYSCLTCNRALHCYPGNAAILVDCYGLRRFCRDGRCSRYQGDKCFTDNKLTTPNPVQNTTISSTDITANTATTNVANSPTTKAETTNAATTSAATSNAATSNAATSNAATSNAATTNAATTNAATTKAATTNAPTTKTPTSNAATTSAVTLNSATINGVANSDATTKIVAETATESVSLLIDEKSTTKSDVTSTNVVSN